MNALSSIRSLLAFIPVVLNAGCGTPAPIRDLARQGAATVGLAEISLREYLALTNSQLAARMDLVRQDARRLASDRSRKEMDNFLDASAGLPPNDATAKIIFTLGDNRRQIREDAARELEKVEQATMLDTATLPQVPTNKLATAKKSFAVLSQELSAKEWIALAAGYAREISKGIKALKAPDAPTDDNH